MPAESDARSRHQTDNSHCLANLLRDGRRQVITPHQAGEYRRKARPDMRIEKDGFFRQFCQTRRPAFAPADVRAGS